MKFLIVDDSPTMRKVIALALKASGFDYTESENGKDALAKISGDKYDFFIVDVNMPGMNGIDLIKELRKKPDYSQTPIIILTTETENDIREEGTQAGANAWIVKPFQKEDLINLINANIG